MLQAATADTLTVIVTTSLGLTVESIGDSYRRVAQLARSTGGYIFSSNVSAGQNGRAAVELRVPASQLDALIDSLKTLLGGRVDSETVASKEVTAEYTDLQSRLRNLERTEAQYQLFLTQAKNIDEVLNVNSRLQATRDEIERTTGRIRLFDNQVEFAMVKLQLSALVPAEATGADRAEPLRVLAAAWDASVQLFWLLLSLGAVMVVGLVWLIPIVVVWLLATRLYRHYGQVLSRLKL